MTVALAGAGVASSAQDATINTAPSTWVPPDVSIETGDSVTWNWAPNQGTHNLAATSGPAADPDWQGQLVGYQSSGQYTRQFTQPGSYAFICNAHPGTMTGTVTVTGDPVEPTPTPTTDPNEPTPTPTTDPNEPTPTATPGPGGGGTPPSGEMGETPAPTGSAAADRTAPAVTGLKLKRITRGARVAFTLSEPATVTVTARKGKRTLRTLRLQVRDGVHKVKIRRLGKGKRTFTLVARDAAGNRSTPVSSSIRVRRK